MRHVWRQLTLPSAEQVVRQHARQVQGHLRRIFGPRDDIDDLCQMVFVEVLKALPSFAGRSKLGTWIRRITWNVAYQEMRQSYRRHRWMVDTLPDEVATSPSDSPETQAQLIQLYDALETLATAQRLVVALHDIEGQTLKEISQALGKPPSTVASQLYAGRQALARKMGAEIDSAPSTTRKKRREP